MFTNNTVVFVKICRGVDAVGGGWSSAVERRPETFDREWAETSAVERRPETFDRGWAETHHSGRYIVARGIQT